MMHAVIYSIKIFYYWFLISKLIKHSLFLAIFVVRDPVNKGRSTLLFEYYFLQYSIFIFCSCPLKRISRTIITTWKFITKNNIIIQWRKSPMDNYHTAFGSLHYLNDNTFVFVVIGKMTNELTGNITSKFLKSKISWWKNHCVYYSTSWLLH